MIDDHDNPDDARALEEMLHRHLSDALSGELGRSATSFAQRLLAETRVAPAPPVKSSALSHLRPWAWLTAAGSVAAAAAVVAVVLTTQNITPHRPDQAMVPDQPEPIERTVYYRTLDDGTVYLDGDTPARQLRRQQVEQVTWLDKRTGQTSRTETVPAEDVMLVAYDKH